MEQDRNIPGATRRKKIVVNVLLHTAVWLVALSLPYMLDMHRGIKDSADNCAHKFHRLNFITNLLWTIPFYFNAYVLTPRLFLQRKYWTHGGVLLLMFGIMLIIHYALFVHIFGLGIFNLRGALGFLLPTFMLTIALSTTFKIAGDKLKADRNAQERQQENLKTELSFLRSQINPHFIFNVLNNLIALEQMKSPELGNTILKLASLMQYMLYETDEDKVPLVKEQEYLQDFIDLQKQRFGKKVAVHVDMDAAGSFYDIEPMLLIPFVENAFKHGIGMIDQPAIDITLSVQNGHLLFSVRNRYNPSSAETKDKTAGIGLQNVRRRLELLYGRRQVLTISQDDNWFSVLLTINFR